MRGGRRALGARRLTDSGRSLQLSFERVRGYSMFARDKMCMCDRAGPSCDRPSGGNRGRQSWKSVTSCLSEGTTCDDLKLEKDKSALKQLFCSTGLCR